MLGTFIAGRYSATYNAVDLGIMRQGYELEIAPKEELLNETDLYGLACIDWVVRGADCFLQFTSKEYKAGPKSVLFGTLTGTFGQFVNATAPVGRFASDLAQALVLTASANTPAAAAPATLTASKSLLAPGYNPKILFDSRLREVPIRLALLPYVSSSDTIFFSTT